jgi:hypothetical protein
MVALKGVIDDAATQAFIVQVKDHRLARRYRSLLLIELHAALIRLQQFDCTGLQRLAMSESCQTTVQIGRTAAGDPMQL